MKNIALIIAGGVGARMHQDIPKQFIHVHDKPVIVYTLEQFQNIRTLMLLRLYVLMDGMISYVHMQNSLALLNLKILLVAVKQDFSRFEKVFMICKKDIMMMMTLS